MTWHHNVISVIFFDITFQLILFLGFLIYPLEQQYGDLIELLQVGILLSYQFCLYYRLDEGEQKFRKDLVAELRKLNSYYIIFAIYLIARMILSDAPVMNFVRIGIILSLIVMIGRIAITTYNVEVSNKREERIRNGISYFALLGLPVALMRNFIIDTAALLFYDLRDVFEGIMVITALYILILSIPAFVLVLGLNRGVYVINRKIWELDHDLENDEEEEVEQEPATRWLYPTS